MLADSLFGLLNSVLTVGDVRSIEARSGALAVMQRHIDAHLGDPDLNAVSLCRTFGLSRPTLYRLFQDEGGVQAYIQRRRLMACFRALSSPHQMKRRIYEIALDFALDNPSHLATLFRQHFGMSPREVREAARHRHSSGRSSSLSAGPPGMTDVERMRQWARELGTSPAAA